VKAATVKAASSVAPPAAPAICQLEYQVAGMDCADCARKIEGVVNKTAGASNPNVNFIAEKLKLALDERITPRAELERRIAAIGYRAILQSESGSQAQEKPDQAETSQHHDHHDHHDHSAEAAELDNKAWWQTKNGRLVLVSALVYLLAFALSFILPNIATYIYVAATIINLYPVALRAWAGVQYGNPLGINMLASIAAIGALAIGEAAEAALVLVLFNVGELMESIAAGQARSGIKALGKLTPKTALLLHGDHTHEVAIAALKVGQSVRILPGMRVPCDGTIEKGSSALDDSPVTGESMPVNKSVGETVFAGSINSDALLQVRVDKPASDNTIARIIKLVSDAEEGKGQTARFIDRFSRYWTPAVLLVSMLVAIVPPVLSLGAWHDWLYKGISLLLIGCPCALLLSVPAAITSGLSSAARRGILIKGGGVLEQLSEVTQVAFDKTGTLTAGKPRVTDVIALTAPLNEALAWAGAVESTSSHPLAKAIVEYVTANNIPIPAVTSASAVAGKAALANLAGRDFAVASPSYAASIAPIAADTLEKITTLEQNGKTVVLLLEDKQVLALFAIRDEPRQDAKAGLVALKALGIAATMLTGDNTRTAKAIASSLGLAVSAELMPEDKLKIIDTMRQEGKVVMVGDGINDAPALAKADVGMAMGTGSDVALETAGAALLRNRVMGVAEAIELARATMNNVRQNIFFALGLKLVFLLTTLLGLSTLWMAILADTGATVIVTINALRLLAFRSRFISDR
jgi:Zn2+/Cd2+-exporting ATPase